MYAKSEKNSGTQKKFELHFSSVVIDSFLSSPLGELWQVLPLASLSASIILPTPKSKAGRKGWFDESQAIAVMLLKHHEGLSDAKLLRNLSTNSDYQLFCGLTFEQGERIQDMTLLSSWRTKFGFHMNVNSFQSILQYHWKKYLSDKQVNKMDATCVESYITFPTSVKLLWRAMEWLHQRIKSISKALRKPQPRNKFREQKKKQRTYQLLKKPSHKQRIKRQKALLHHVELLIMQLEQLGIENLKTRHQWRLKVIKAMFEQQKQHFAEPDSKIENRIVSLHKDYVRPIVRGKENKPDLASPSSSEPKFISIK